MDYVTCDSGVISTEFLMIQIDVNYWYLVFAAFLYFLWKFLEMTHFLRGTGVYVVYCIAGHRHSGIPNFSPVPD